jgi:hypothetical protein
LLLKKEKHEIVNVLKGHNDEVHSLVWSPVPASDLPEGKEMTLEVCNEMKCYYNRSFSNEPKENILNNLLKI